MPKVLIVATSHDKLGDSDQPTGCWAEEIMAPILIWQEAGFEVTVASMKGGKIPIDEGSMTDDFRTPDVEKFLKTEANKRLIEQSVKLDDIPSGAAYDVVYIPGGHGVCYDMPDSTKLQKLVAEAYDQGKLVSSVCHGPAALVNVKIADGSYLVADKEVSGFANTEEEAVGKTKYVPFLLEDKLKERGGKYSKAGDWSSYVKVAGRLITGQNPQSSKEVATKVVEALKWPAAAAV